MFLSSSPSVTGFQQFFFCIVKGGVFSQLLTTNMKYLLFVKLCITVELRMQHSAYFVNIVCACVARGAVV